MARAGQNGNGPLARNSCARCRTCGRRSRRMPISPWPNGPDAPDLPELVFSAVVQGDGYGIALAGVLRTQAKQMSSSGGNAPRKRR